MNKIVFDFDGTLLDSSARHTLLLNDIGVELRLFTDNRRISELFSGYFAWKKRGIGTKRFLLECCGLSEELAEKCTSLWIDRIETPQYLSMDQLFSDSLYFLERLINQYQLILISARQQEKLLREQVVKLDIQHYFADIYCVSPLNATAEKSQIISQYKGETEVVVGDTEVDWRAAQVNQIPFYALYRGFRGVEFWTQRAIKAYPDLSCLQKFIR